MDAKDKQILIESMRSPRNPNPVIPDYAVRMLEDTCERTGLDWKLRHVYLIERGGKWQVTTSIDGFRLVANADPEYAGQEGPFWTDSPTGQWTDIPPAKEPYAAKIGVVRNKNGVCVTTYGVAKFSDYNAGSPMWKKMGPTMVAKCAEALALRKALPGKLGGLYTIEEMEQAEVPKKSVRNSTSAKSAKADSLPMQGRADFESAGEKVADEEKQEAAKYLLAIQKQETVEDLQKLGAEIAKTNLGLKAKQELSLQYNDRKALLLKAKEATANVEG